MFRPTLFPDHSHSLIQYQKQAEMNTHYSFSATNIARNLLAVLSYPSAVQYPCFFKLPIPFSYTHVSVHVYVNPLLQQVKNHFPFLQTQELLCPFCPFPSLHESSHSIFSHLGTPSIWVSTYLQLWQCDKQHNRIFFRSSNHRFKVLSKINNFQFCIKTIKNVYFHWI